MKKIILGLLICSVAFGAAKIQNADIKANANISDTKLATIFTAGKVSNSATTAVSSNVPSSIVSRDPSGNFSAGTLTLGGANLNGAIGNGATVGALNVKGTDSLGSQLQLEGPNSSNGNRFMYFTQRENGDFFMYNPGLNRVIFDYNAASNATSIGQSSGNYQFNVTAPDSGTSLATILQGTGLGIANTDTTDGNFSVLGFQGSDSGRSPDSAVFGVHDDHNGASATGSLEFWTRNGGTFARAARLSPTKIWTFDGYSTGVLQTNSSGVVSAGTAPVANGGTGLTATPTNGQLAIGNGSGYTLGTITAGDNITITNGSGTITVSGSAGGAGTTRTWRGRHEYPCGWGTTAASFTDVGADANCTFAEIHNNGMGTVASMVSGGSLTAGIFYTPLESADYKICATTPFNNDTAGQAAAIRLIDNVSYEWARDMVYAGGTADYNSKTMCGIATLTSGVSRSVRIQTSVPAFSGTARMGNQIDGGETDYVGIEWEITKQ